tara:strand:+ start:1215 stop:2279 length:1065 start_codon:yes stop_codon:yes gene_type:complete
MNVFCYFVEPASYTIDLIKNIYEKHSINYSFIKSNTFCPSDKFIDAIFLDKFSFFIKLKFLLKNYRNSDFIIINGYNNYVFIFTFIFNLISSCKRYIAIDSDTQNSIPKNLFKRFIKWIYLSIVFRNRYVVGFAGGNRLHKDLFRYYGMKEHNIFLMPMMVNNLKFFQSKKFFPKIFTFLYVGRLVKHKNVESLIQTFNKHFTDKNVIIKIIGSGDEEFYLQEKYASDQVLFLGKMLNDDLIYEFQQSSCLVFPSTFEPWGLVINEALSAGLPVITSNNVGASYDLVKDKNTGMIASNMEDFGNKMLELYNNNNLLIDFSKNASDLMLKYWNYHLYKKCLLEAMKKINASKRVF